MQDVLVMNITLIGMSGSGKSSVGKIIAEEIGYTYIDTDRIIEEQEGGELQGILDRVGEKKFLEIETAIVGNLKDLKNAVISSGGSVVYSPKAMEHLRKISKIVHLFASFDVLKERNDAPTRGIVGLDNKTYEELFHERINLYNTYADEVVDIKHDTPLAVAQKVISLLNLDNKA